jgi:sestrin 1/3
VRQIARDLIIENRHVLRACEQESPSRFEKLPGIDWKHISDSLPISSPGYALSHLDWALSVQGGFLSLFHRTNDELMSGEGPLPRPWRHFIAMMGASRYRCEYIVRHELALFLSTGGDVSWITDGAEALPKKLVSLFALNAILAHRPWAIEARDVDTAISLGRWSASELVHALVILATYQSMASLVFGSGIKLEEDLAVEEELGRIGSSVDPLIESDLIWETENEFVPACFSMNESSPGLIQRLLAQSNSTRQPTSIDESSTRISAFEGFGALNDPSGHSSPVSTTPASRSAPKLDDEAKGELASIMASSPRWATPVSNLVNATPVSLNIPILEYRDFSPKTDKMLHSTSFSWEDHGMMILDRQTSDTLTECINSEFLHALEFSTHTIGDLTLGESTSTVREAIVKYVQRMYGIFHDDYRYDRLNKILPVMDKAYLKKLACYPERLTQVDYMRLRTFEGFSPNDLIHLAHLVSQTKRLVTLTWAMHAVVQFQAKQHQL